MVIVTGASENHARATSCLVRSIRRLHPSEETHPIIFYDLGVSPESLALVCGLFSADCNPGTNLLLCGCVWTASWKRCRWKYGSLSTRSAYTTSLAFAGAKCLLTMVVRRHPKFWDINVEAGHYGWKPQIVLDVLKESLTVTLWYGHSVRRCGASTIAAHNMRQARRRLHHA